MDCGLVGTICKKIYCGLIPSNFIHLFRCNCHKEYYFETWKWLLHRRYQVFAAHRYGQKPFILIWILLTHHRMYACAAIYRLNAAHVMSTSTKPDSVPIFWESYGSYLFMGSNLWLYPLFLAFRSFTITISA